MRDSSPYDLARKDPGSSPKVGPIRVRGIVRPIASSQPKDPRSSLVPPSLTR